MQSSKAFLLSPSPTPLRRTTTRIKQQQPLNPNPNPSFITLKSHDLRNSINGVSSSSSSLRKSFVPSSLCYSFSSSSSSDSASDSSSLLSSCSGGFDSIPSLVSGRGGDDFSVKATAKTEAAGESSDSKNVSKTLELGVLLVFWYGFNIYFNIFNKQVLKIYPFPLTISAFQFGVGTVLILLMWMFNLHKKPKITTSQLQVILPLAILHTFGNLFTNMSLGKVSVSFTHTIKAMEPFFSVLFSAMFLGEVPTVWVVMSLLPVVGGVALASLTEASFNWIGFTSAMASNMTNQSRNVFSKKLMVKKEEALDNINLFSVLTIMSFLLMTPVALYMEGIKFTPSYLQSAGFNVRELCVRALLAGVSFHTYQQLSYMILQRVSPVTHSVSNCVKRVVVIVSSVIFFRTPVSPINAIGTGIALAGVFIYSRVKQIKPKRKTV